ncbi:MAG TPA: hypothetical protein PLN52_12825 [Opitutaceae bacterium]|nr:hypothetical protein [Opitutaceae bacterium]
MKRLPLVLFVWFAVHSASASWIPKGLPPLVNGGPTLCPGPYLTPEQGQTVLEEAREHFADAATWLAYAQEARKKIQAGAGLTPLPRRTPLNPLIGPRRDFDGYSVENIAFESVPGYWVCGNLYRPAKLEASFPVVLSTHGHSRPVVTEADLAQQGRFTPWMQARCAALARLGAVVLSIEMVGYGESGDQFGQSAHKRPFSLTLQTWNAMRALDFLLALEGADPKRVAVSGESGGGTQSFLLTALDSRVTVSAPVVMVSSYFFGGCPCESGLPIHRSADHFANNVLIAALAAPRPQLLVSNGDDWTKYTTVSEFPFLQHVYGLLKVREAVANVHLPLEKHDYGPSKRAALYRFLSDRFELRSPGSLQVTPEILEKNVVIESVDALRAFPKGSPHPQHAARSIEDVEKVLVSLQ